jgi:acetate kinase
MDMLKQKIAERAIKALQSAIEEEIGSPITRFRGIDNVVHQGHVYDDSSEAHASYCVALRLLCDHQVATVAVDRCTDENTHVFAMQMAMEMVSDDATHAQARFGGL